MRLPAGTAEVLAPSLAALEVFAAARRQGATCTLLADLPDLARLHLGLDDAAARWPGCDFLHNHRASPAVVARQAAEWRNADQVWVRSRFAAAQLRALRFPTGPARVIRAYGGPWTVRLAGLATARNGAAEALAALERLPGVRLAARLGDGAWPDALRGHPRVVPADRPCHLLGAPSWVETGDAEVEAAARAGVPVVATERGAGWTTATIVPCGDVEALVQATRHALFGHRTTAESSAAAGTRAGAGGVDRGPLR